MILKSGRCEIFGKPSKAAASLLTGWEGTRMAWTAVNYSTLNSKIRTLMGWLCLRLESTSFCGPSRYISYVFVFVISWRAPIYCPLLYVGLYSVSSEQYISNLKKKVVSNSIVPNFQVNLDGVDLNNKKEMICSSTPAYYYSDTYMTCASTLSRNHFFPRELWLQNRLYWNPHSHLQLSLHLQTWNMSIEKSFVKQCWMGLQTLFRLSQRQPSTFHLFQNQVVGGQVKNGYGPR